MQHGPLFLLLFAASAHAQTLTWSNVGTLYGDNTEFFTPYRTGETILGGSLRSYLNMQTGRRTELHAGFFADHRSGSDQFAHPFRPIITFRFHTATSTGTLGTMFPVRRRGFLEPLEGTTLELTRAIEYGLEWNERRRWWSADAFLDWQKLNTPKQREVFDYGGVAAIKPVRFARIEGQLHGVHHGGQLYDANAPVVNNVVKAIGIVLADSVAWVGGASLSAFRLTSHGTVAPERNPPTAPDHGSGTYLRAGITPRGWFELFAVSWRGHDFISNEGDNNYNSIGANAPYYRAERKYLEVGVQRRMRIEGAVTFDAELRFHQIDGGIKSISLFDSRWEYSYRLIARAPFDLVLR